jgi:hypothetical protein
MLNKYNKTKVYYPNLFSKKGKDINPNENTERSLSQKKLS